MGWLIGAAILMLLAGLGMSLADVQRRGIAGYGAAFAPLLLAVMVLAALWVGIARGVSI